ncbi:uncharacterized protein LOC134944620 isoform X1 [Pseudophryne corroboree]|uniref:uncharacterized protein LOC134944620 isoform X1 n=1 Tax=Pseudophryne corroboree TaxID=495146 RepID=UPI0030820DD2
MMKIILFAIFLLVSLLTMGTQGRPIYPSEGSAEAPLAQASQSRSFNWHQVTLDWKTVGTNIGFIGLVILAGICLCCTAYFQTLKECLSNAFHRLIYGVVQDDIETLLQQHLPQRAHRYLELDDDDDDEDEEPRGKHHYHVKHEMGHHQRDHHQKHHVAERHNIVRNGRKDPRQMKKEQKPSIKKILKKPIQKLNVKKFVPKAPKIVQKLKVPKFIKKMRR